jgi:hypothetical protein
MKPIDSISMTPEQQEDETNFSTLVVDLDTWETGIISVLPLREEILRDGVSVCHRETALGVLG